VVSVLQPVFIIYCIYHQYIKCLMCGLSANILVLTPMCAPDTARVSNSCVWLCCMTVFFLPTHIMIISDRNLINRSAVIQ